jgi:hypothetical protein
MTARATKTVPSTAKRTKTCSATLRGRNALMTDGVAASIAKKNAEARIAFRVAAGATASRMSTMVHRMSRNRSVQKNRVLVAGGTFTN